MRNYFCKEDRALKLHIEPNEKRYRQRNIESVEEHSVNNEFPPNGIL